MECADLALPCPLFPLLPLQWSCLHLQSTLVPTRHPPSQEGALLHGFVASATPDAVFVRFLGHVTGRAGLSQLSDTFVSDPRRCFREGQSVRAQVRGRGGR